MTPASGRRCLPRAACLSLLVAGVGTALPHTLPISYLSLAAGEDYLHLELVFNPFELQGFEEMDSNQNFRLDPVEWTQHEATVARQIDGALNILVDGRLIPAEVSGATLDPDSHHASFRAHYPVDVRQQAFVLESALPNLSDGSHICQVTFRGLASEQLAQLDMQSRKVRFGPAPQPEPPPAPLKPPDPATAPPPPGSRLWLALMPLLALAGLALVHRTRRSINHPHLP